MTAEALVLFEVDIGGVATLTLNRPDKLNAFTYDMITQWRDTLDRVASDDAVKVVVLTGAGKAFCAGGDAGAMERRAEQTALEQRDFLWRHVHRIALAMDQLDKPVIAAINGAARGAGLDMALMCDIRFMAESATVAESYINMGLVAGDGGAYYLPPLIGVDRALEMCWTGRAVGAQEAERIGLVTRAVPDAELLPAVYELAQRIAAQPQTAVRMYKRAIYQGATQTLAAHLDMVASHTAVLRGTPEHRERVAAFLQKRAKS